MKRLALLLVLAAVPARAEIALLDSGATLKLSSHHSDGQRMSLTLLGGGEVEVAESSVLAFFPDEIVDESALGADLRALVRSVASRYGLPPELVLAVVAVESGFHPEAVSKKGAQGLMQLMPATAAGLGVENPFDPAQNVDGGTRHPGRRSITGTW